MILADTCIWADHLGPGDPVMADQIAARNIIMHAYVLGEIALGHLRQRELVLKKLGSIPTLPLAGAASVLSFIDRHSLAGAGIGYVDAHLLASTLLAPGTRLWTRDKRLHAAAERLGIAAKPTN